jgi:hypothetical protein
VADDGASLSRSGPRDALPLGLERDGVAIAGGFCLCQESLLRAAWSQRLRLVGKVSRVPFRPVRRSYERLSSPDRG